MKSKMGREHQEIGWVLMTISPAENAQGRMDLCVGACGHQLTKYKKFRLNPADEASRLVTYYIESTHSASPYIWWCPREQGLTQSQR